MIVDYRLNQKYLPSQRQVWLMSKEMERDGKEVNIQILKAMESGEVKYVNGVLYKLCRHCLEYLPAEDFYPNKRYVMDIGYICKNCTSIRRRIKKYGAATYITEVGMEEKLNYDIKYDLDAKSKEILKRRFAEE